MVSAEVREAFDASAVYFPTTIQAVQYYDKYARWNEEKGRRETWIETVTRAVNFLRELSHNRLSDTTYQEIQDAILNHDVMPSMRLLATAGKAARRQNLSIFNCSSQPVHSLHSFVEALIISMAGCGVGYSVERKYVDLLPEVKPFAGNLPDDGLHVIADSAEGWAEAFYCGLVRWFDGDDLEYDYSLIRPAGAILRTKGGQASGPRPLAKMLAKVRRIIIDAAGRKLTTVEAHHIMCLVGDCAVAGGVRRTAMIALFDPDDDGMLRVKSGDMSGIEHLYNANNSLCWPADEVVGDELLSSHMDEMFGAMRGEPGIWNHYSAQKYMPERRRNLLTIDVANPPAFWPQGIDIKGFSTNPCGEISFIRPFGLCNLSIAVARKGDTYADLQRKVQLATIIGTIQSMATHFPGLRPMWKWNAERERLLGVDLSGQMDCDTAQIPEVLAMLKNEALETNRLYASLLDIPQSAAVTCNKPNGNSSVFLNCSPGIGSRKYRYCIRRITLSSESPMWKVLHAHGWPMEKKRSGASDQWLALFPIAAPDGTRTEADMSALDQCENWLKNKIHWTEHNPSVTVLYRESEVPALRQWISDHRDVICGMTFYPLSDARFEQQPYEEITRAEYNRMVNELPTVDFSLITHYERHDTTTAAQELACTSGMCEIM